MIKRDEENGYLNEKSNPKRENVRLAFSFDLSTTDDVASKEVDSATIDDDDWPLRFSAIEFS